MKEPRRNSSKYMGFFNKIKTIADNAIEISKDKISSFIDSEKVKEIALQYFVKINFSTVLTHLRLLEHLNPKLKIVIQATEKIKVIVDEYHLSNDDNRDRVLTDNLLSLTKEIDFETVAIVLEPFANNIPFGNIFLTAIKLIVSFTNKK